MSNETSFERELQSLISRHSQENGSDTPDYVLAEFMNESLKTFNRAIKAREKWYNRGSAGTVSDELAKETLEG